MRFCHITTFFPPYHFGGDGLAVADLANSLAAAGHSVDVIHCADSYDLLRGSRRPSSYPVHPAVRVHTLRSRWGRLSPVFTYFTGHAGPKKRPLAEILSQDFDVVHWHNISLIGPAALALARGVRICTLHEYWLLCPTSILFRYNREVCERRTCLRCLMIHKRPPPLWRGTGLLQRSLRFVDRFLVNSRFAQGLLSAAGLPVETCYVPPLVADAARVEPPARAKPYYLFVGRLIRAKGLQTILPLFLRTGRKLLVAGAGEYEPELRRLAAGAPDIQFLGHVSAAELPALYAGAAATVVPSLCYEIGPRVVIESLQQGTPALVPDRGAMPEIVRGTGGGWVYGSLEELEGILDRIDSHPEEARRVGERGRQATWRFGAENHLREYFAVIEQIRACRSSPAATPS